jgi:shikimate dehydrogenase
MTRDPNALTLTLDDLSAWSEPGTHLAVLGHPVDHSLSPPMHQAALAELAGREPAFATWRYWKVSVPPERLAEALALLHARRFFGVNLTVPHKILAVLHVVAVDPAAQAIGAVNTLRWRADGYEGFNTDGYGLATGLAEDLGIALAGADVVLLGAGGAARGAAVECLRRGCRSLAIGNRSPEPLGALLALLAPLAGAIPVRGFALGDAATAGLPSDALVINATSAGLHPDAPPPIDLGALSGRPRVYDMIYNPPQTPLLRDAAARGLAHAHGLSMLVHQGVRALEIWSGRPVSAAAMAEAARAGLAAQLATA